MSHFSTRLRLLARPAVSWYLLSCLLATFGAGLSYVAMAWLVLKAAHSLSAMAILLAMFWIPNVILGPFVGVLADRVNRKWLIIISTGVRAALLFIFWIILNDNTAIWLIYLFSFINGLAFSIYLPATMAFIREIVTENELLYVNANIDIAYESGNIIGMGCAGLIIAATSLQFTFLVNAIAFLLSAACLICIKHKNTIKHIVQKSFLQQAYSDLKAGLLYLRDRHELRLVYLVQMLVLVSYMTAPVFLAPFAKQVLHTSVAQFGEIEAALSVGVVLGGIFGPYFADKFGLRRVLIIENSILAICFYFFKQTQWLMYADVLYFLIGFCYSAWPIVVTTAQEMTELAYQGRVQATFNVLSGGIILAIYGVLYFAGNSIPLAQYYWFEIIVALLAVLLLWRIHFRRNQTDVRSNTVTNIE